MSSTLAVRVDHLEELIMAGGRNMFLDRGELHEELASADEVGVHSVCSHILALHTVLL